MSRLQTEADQLLIVRASGAVERCHTVRHFGSYNLAQHQWGAAMLLRALFPDHFKDLVEYVLTHDVPEVVVGDIPGQVLVHRPDVRAALGELEERVAGEVGVPSEHRLTGLRRRILKAVDRLELWLWCREQEEMGNRFVVEMRLNLEQYFAEEPLPEPAHEFYQYMQGRNVLPRHGQLARELSE